MSQTSDDRSETEMRSEYDFSGGVRGKYHEAYHARDREPERREELVLFQQVVLCCDCPEQKLSIGDEATLLDFIPHPKGGEEGCILEIFDDVGRVAIVPISAVRVLRSAYDFRHLEVWKKVDQEIASKSHSVQ
jgi:hypothetical protein